MLLSQKREQILKLNTIKPAAIQYKLPRQFVYGMHGPDMLPRQPIKILYFPGYAKKTPFLIWYTLLFPHFRWELWVPGSKPQLPPPSKYTKMYVSKKMLCILKCKL